VDTQLRKGLLEFCVLAALEKEDSYGYQIIKDISDFVTISESTLYPILRRMEIAGYVISYTEEYNNRLRKYFHLSDDGKEYLSTFRKEKGEILRILEFIEGVNCGDEKEISE
jgi:PadR family transcriptional regulator PadR